MNILDEWTAAVCAELGIESRVDRDLVLDMTRDVAHGVARPAAPLTAYLIGLAAGASADPAETTTQACRRMSVLAADWPRGRR